MIKTVTPLNSTMGAKSTSVFLVVIMAISTVSADPPPGSPEVLNSVCDTNVTPGGICDDYDSNLDGSIGPDWSQIAVQLSMESASEIEIEIFVAMHEVSRTQLGLQEVDLEGDSGPEDGIPADHIRNFFDEETGDGRTVSDRMFDEVDRMVANVLGENFESIGQPVTNTVSIVPRTLSSNLQCTADSSIDSADEDEFRDNDPFWPPICVRSALSVTINASSIGMDETRGNLDRTLLGLLIMGASVDLEFDLLVEPGQSLEMSLIPPPYAEVTSARQGTSIVSQDIVDFRTQRFAVIDKNRIGENSLQPASPLTLDATIRHLPDETPTVDLSQTDEPGLSINLVVDAVDTSRARFGLDIALHHLDSSTLEAWSIDIEQDGVDVPWVTADGLRLLDEETDVGLNQVINGIPMDEISESLSQVLGNDIQLETPFFSQTNETGGLEFIHTPGSTCSETSPSRYCLVGPNSMGTTYPILISAYSNPAPIELSKTFERLLENSGMDVAQIDISAFTDEDLARMMSVLSVDLSHDVGWIAGSLPDILPDSDLQIRIDLPSWVRSTSGNPSNLILDVAEGDAIQQISVEGTRQFDWRHAICMNSTPCTDDSQDVICKSSQSTCVAATIDFIIESISIRELSSSAIVDFDLRFTIDLYRVDVDFGIEGVEISPMPSDLMRHVVSVGDRTEGGILNGTEFKRIDSPFPNDNHPIDLDISNEGLQDLADEMTNRIRLQMIELSKEEGPEIELGTLGSVTPIIDFSDAPLDLFVDRFESLQSPELSDQQPLQIGGSMSDAQVRISLNDDELGIRVAEQTAFGTFISTIRNSISPEISMDGIGPFSGAVNVVPLDEETELGTIRPVVIERIKLPKSIDVLVFESSMQRAFIERSGEHTTLVYLTPVFDCEDAEEQSPCETKNDTVELSIMISWSLVLTEAVPYLIGISVILGLLVWRRRVKRIMKRRKKADVLEKATMEWIESVA